MPATIVDAKIVRELISKCDLNSIGLGSIRDIRIIGSQIEEKSGTVFFHSEYGSPILSPPRSAMEAEAEAVMAGIGSKYPASEGIPGLKTEISYFVSNFLDVIVSPEGCLPTVGSIQGSYMAMLMACRRNNLKQKILFIDPGFSLHKTQARSLGLQTESFDVYDFRGCKLGPKLDSYLAGGDVACILYSSPNNPAWICFTEEELEIIGRLCEQYDVIALEDMAYLGMDFRRDYSRPGVPPFIPTVASYTNRYILLLSASKAFSMAGQRIGMSIISDYLYNSRGEHLRAFFDSDRFGHNYISGMVNSISSGVCHTTQLGLAALLKAINTGQYDFIEPLREYERRAVVIKKIFMDNGFRLVYDHDGDQPLADGFYFTVSYPGFSGAELVEELLYYGIGTIALTTAGSMRHEGIRVSITAVNIDGYDELGRRLRAFRETHCSGFRAIDGD